MVKIVLKDTYPHLLAYLNILFPTHEGDYDLWKVETIYNWLNNLQKYCSENFNVSAWTKSPKNRNQ